MGEFIWYIRIEGIVQFYRRLEVKNLSYFNVLGYRSVCFCFFVQEVDRRNSYFDIIRFYKVRV